MSTPVDTLPGLRTPIPSDRERTLDPSRPQAAMPVAAPILSGASRSVLAGLASLVRDANPRRALQGQSGRPIGVLGGQGLVQGFGSAVKSVSYGLILIDLGVSNGLISTLAVLTGVGGVLLGLGAAYLADRIPRLIVVGVACLAFGLSLLYLGVAASVFAFVVMSVSQSLFGSGSFAASNSLLADYYPPERRGRIFALSGSIGTLGGIVFAPLAGLLVYLIGWRTGLAIGGCLAIVASAAVLALREPVRGRWDLLRLGASAQVAGRARKPPALAEAVRTVRSVRTLRRVCQAQIFLAASGVISLPLIILISTRVVDANALAVGLVIAAQSVATLLGIQAGGILADRTLAQRPGTVMHLLGAAYFVSLAALAVFAFVANPFVVIPLSVLISFLNAAPTTAESVLISQVTPARVRTTGLQLPSFYGLLGMLLVLPFIPLLSGGSLAHVFLVVAAIGIPGGVLYLTAAVDVTRDMEAARLAVLAEGISEAAAADGHATLLVCRGVDVHYEGVQVLFGVDLTVAQGELIALLGTNGAGKSTLLRAISGLSEPSGGAVFFDGRDTTHAPPYELARAGMVAMPGGKGVFPSLTVADNLRTAGWLLAAEEVGERIEGAYLMFPRLRERRSALAGNLSGGEQQMLAVSQAMIMRPRLLLVDELSLGLAPAVVEQLLQAISRLHDQGTTIILVEQSVDLALSVAQRAVFMEKGEVRFDGPAAELRQHPELLRSIYITGTRAKTAPAPRQSVVARATNVLSVQGASVNYGGVQALTEAQLRVASGEIVGLIGPNGAGKTTLFDAICGLVPLQAGSVCLSGRDVTALEPRQRASHGLARSFQDARLFPALTLVENVQVAMHLKAGLNTNAALAALWLPQARRGEADLRRRAEATLDLLGLAAQRDKVPAELSTGTRRIADLACMIATQPEVLLLDEPSSGIAQAEAEELGPLLDRVRRESGCGLVLIEHDMSLLTSVADRMVGMVLGRTVIEGSVAEVTTHPVMVAAYLGASERTLRRSRTNSQRPLIGAADNVTEIS